MHDINGEAIYTTRVRGVVVGALTRQQVIDSVVCPDCSAQIGTICNDRPEGKNHRARRLAAFKLYGILPPQAVLHGKYIDNWYRKFRAWANDPDAEVPEMRPARRKSSRPRGKFITRYECPICGGPHSRADHASRPKTLAGTQGIQAQATSVMTTVSEELVIKAFRTITFKFMSDFLAMPGEQYDRVAYKDPHEDMVDVAIHVAVRTLEIGAAVQEEHGSSGVERSYRAAVLEIAPSWRDW